MEPEIAFLWCDRTIDEWVNDVPQVEIFADLLYNLVVPRAARFPGEVPAPAFRFFEEPSQVRDILFCLSELCRALKEYRSCIQRIRTRERRFETLGDDVRGLKRLGVETVTSGKYGEVPVYDEQTFETNVQGVYVAGHFTKHRHIKGAIDAGKTIVPTLAAKLKFIESGTAA